MIARLLDGRSRADGLEHARVIVGIIAFQHKPVIQMGLTGPVHSASAGKIGIEVEHFVAAEADGVRGSDLLVDQIAKLAGEIPAGNAKTIRAEKLVDSEMDSAAAFGAKRGVAGIAGIG